MTFEIKNLFNFPFSFSNHRSLKMLHDSAMMRSLSFVTSGSVKELGIETIEFNFGLNKTGVCSWSSIEFELNGSLFARCPWEIRRAQ